MKVNEEFNVVFRSARMDDVEQIIALENSVWGDGAANRDQIVSRIKTFPGGSIVAVYNKQIVGYVVFEYVDNITDGLNFSWKDVTDNGLIAKSHKPKGKYIFGINLTADQSMSVRHFGFALTLQVWIDAILKNKKGVFLGSRVPGFAKYKEKNPETTIEQYVFLKRHDRPIDPELRLYDKDGLKPVRVLVEYFPDPPSLNYGVLIYRNNPFYNWPLRKLWAYIVKKIPKLRSSFNVKGGAK